MDECPWCGKEIDAEDIYRFGDLDNDGYYECPECGGQFSINQIIVYEYEIAQGPKKREVEGSYKDARGILPWQEGDEPAEDTIRRLRGYK